MEFLSRKAVWLPRWAVFVSPGRIHLTGRHVGDIAAERDGDVPGRGGGLAEVDGSSEQPKLGYEYELLRMSQRISPVYVLNVSGLKWYEIDDESDLVYAERYILPYC